MNTLTKYKNIFIGIAIVAVAGLLFWWGKSSSKQVEQKQSELPQIELVQNVDRDDTSLDLLNRTYVIDDTAITLSGGVASEPVAGGSALMITNLIPGTAYGDVNGDGKTDAVVLLRNEAGGPGVYYYAALVTGDETTSDASQAVYLGDRIRIHEITLHKQAVMIDIRERGIDDTFVGVPDVSKALLYEVVGADLALQ